MKYRNSGMLRKMCSMILVMAMLISPIAQAAQGTLTLPKALRIVADEAFKGNATVENIIIPDGAESIGREAFAGCTSLQTVTIPDSVEAIGENAFLGCENVTIICSRNSTAASYAELYGIQVQYTDAEPDEPDDNDFRVEWEQLIHTAYTGIGEGVLAAAAQVVNYTQDCHDIWSVERLDDRCTSDAELTWNVLRTDGDYISFDLASTEGCSAGEIWYRLSVACEGGYTHEQEFCIVVESLPETLPTELDLEEDYYEFTVGDTFDFYYNEVGFANGSVPEGSYLVNTFPAISSNPLWQNNSVTYTGDVLSIAFETAGEYSIDLYCMINNYAVVRTITFVVSEPVENDFYIEAYQFVTTAYTEMSEGEEVFAAVAKNFTEDCHGIWSVERLDDLCTSDVELTWKTGRPDGDYLSVQLGSTEGCSTGEIWYRLSVEGENGYTYEQDFCIAITELPENMPTALTMEEDYFEFNVGEVFELYYNEIGFADGEIPEGASVYNDFFHISYNPIWQNNSVTFTGDVFSVLFETPGEYVIDLCGVINNYRVFHTITIVVNEEDDSHISLHAPLNTFFMGIETGDPWVFDASLEGIELAEGEFVEWRCEPIGPEEGETPAIEIIACPEVSENEGNRWMRFEYSSLNFVGETTWRVYATLGEQTWEADVTLAVAELPEALPTELDYPDVTTVAVGMEYWFLYDEIGFADGEIPEGTGVQYQFWGLENGIEQQPSFGWFDDGRGFHVAFDEAGEYTMTVAAYIGNHILTKDVTIIATTDVLVEHQQLVSTLYTGCDTYFYINGALIHNYTAEEGEEVWSLERVEEECTSDAELYIEHLNPALNYIGLVPVLDGRTTGEIVYILRANTASGLNWETEIRISIEELPENLPTDLAVEQDYFEFNVGDYYEFPYNSIDFVDGDVPADAYVFNDVRNFSDNWYESDNGFGMDSEYLYLSLFTPGEYCFDVARFINNHVVYHTITIGVREPHLSLHAPLNTFFMDVETGDPWVFDAHLEGITPAEGEYVEWNFEPIGLEEGETPAIEIIACPEASENEAYRWMRFEYSDLNFEGETTWRVYATLGEQTWEADVTLAVAELPEALPTELIYPDVTTVAVGMEYWFLYNEIGFADGEIPEGTGVQYQFWGLENGIEQQPSFQWIDDGFQVAFEEPGEYTMTVAAYIGNYILTKDVTVVATTDKIVEQDQYVHTLYTGYDDHYDIGTALIHNYTPEEDEYVWTLERVEDECTSNAELYIEEIYHDLSQIFIVPSLGDCTTGEICYILRAETADGFTWETEIRVSIEELPENLPTELAVEQDYFEFNVGDYFEFHYSDIDFADGEVPGDARVYTNVLNFSENWHTGNTIALTDGKTLYTTFEEPGEYHFDVVRFVNNYPVCHPVTFVVNDGFIGIGQTLTVAYMGIEANDRWVFDASLEDVGLEEGDFVEWGCEPVGLEEGEIPAIEIITCPEVSENENGRWMRYEYSNLNFEGETTWRIYATLGDRIWEDYVTLRAAELPENMPTELTYPHDTCIEIGEDFVFNFSDVTANGEIPENAYPYIGLGNVGEDSYIAQMGDFEWTDEGFRVSFDAADRYYFYIDMFIGNYVLTQKVYVTVGNGISEDIHLDWTQIAHTLYMDASDTWIGDAYLSNFISAYDDEITWTLTPAEDYENPVMDVRLGDTWNWNCGINIFANPISDEPGSMAYILTARVYDLWEESVEITLHLEELPEDLPTALDMGDIPTDYQIEVGETFEFHAEGIGFADGTVPEDAFVRYELWGLNEGIEQQENFEYFEKDWEFTDAGFRATFNEPGRYHFYVVRKVNTYAVAQEIRITVGEFDPESIRIVSHEYPTTLYTNEPGCWLGWWALDNYTLFDNDEVQWSLWWTPADENAEAPIVPLMITDYWERGDGLNIHVGDTTDATGEETYLLTCTINGVEISSEIRVNVVEAPENLPQDMWIDSTEYTIQPGEEFEFTYDMFGIPEEELPEGMTETKNLWISSELENAPGFEWTENGVRFIPEADGRYRFEAALHIANHPIIRTVTITVGSSVSENFGVDWLDWVSEMYADHGDVWVTDAHIHDYAPPAGCEIEWNVVPKDETAYIPVELYINNVWDDELSASFCMRQTGDEPGEATWIITATAGDEVIVEREITLYLSHLPEGMPTELNMGDIPTDYQLDVGEFFEFHAAGIEFADGNVSEGANVYYELWGLDAGIEHQAGFEGFDEDCGRIDSGFRATFYEPGRYHFYVARKINNYAVVEEIRITVGEIDYESVCISNHQEVYTLYTDSPSAYIGRVYLENFCFFDSDSVEWQITRITDENSTEEPIVELRVSNDLYDNIVTSGRTANMTGSETYRIACILNGEELAATEITVNVVELPEDICNELWLDSDVYYVEVGEPFEYSFSNFDLPEGSYVPEDAYVYKDVVFYREFFDMGDIQWTDDGIIATLPEPGYYYFYPCVTINNHNIAGRDIVLIVGEGASMHSNVNNAIFSDVEGDFWIGDFWIENFHITDNQWISWSVEQVNNDASLGHIRIGEISDDSLNANIFLSDLTGEAGEMTFRVTAFESDIACWSEEFTIAFIERPDELPGNDALTMRETNIHLEVGEEYVCTFDDIIFDDSMLPEDFAYSYDFWLPQEMYDIGVEGFEDGFRITFNEAGRYEFTTVVILTADYHIECPVVITVGDGNLSQAFINVNQAVDTVYPGYGGTRIGDWSIENYRILGSDNVEWKLERYTDEHSPEEPLVNLWISVINDDRMGLSIEADDPRAEYATEDYTLTLIVNGEEIASTTIHVTVAEAPENMPEDMWLDSDEYTIQPGEEFEFTYDMFGIPEDELPEGMNEHKEIWIPHEIGELPGFEWRENSFVVTPEADGRYRFEVAIRLGNYIITRFVTITVGSGVSENFGVDWEDRLFEMYADHGDEWVADAYIHDYAPPAGCEIVWNVTPKDDTAYIPVELYVSNTWDGNLSASFSMRQTGDEPGEAIWIITATAGDELIVEREVALYLSNLPEDIPTALNLGDIPTDYQLNVGDFFEFHAAGIEFADGTVPEGAQVRYEIWNLHEGIEHLDGFEGFEEDRGRIDAGFRVTFNEPSRYHFYVARKINNYAVTEEIRIIVGDGNLSNAQITGEYAVEEMYPGCGGAWIGDWYLENYNILDNDDVEWTLERYTDEHSPEEPLVNLWISGISDDRMGLSIEADDPREEYATEEYILTCTVNGIEVASTTIYMAIVEMPENMPEELWVECDDFSIQPGEEFTFTFDMFGFPEDQIPEGKRARKQIYLLTNLWEQNGFEWFDNGFHVSPDADGRFIFNVSSFIGNYMITRRVTLTVGTGVSENFGVDWDDQAFEMAPGQDDVFVTGASIHDYAPPAGIDVEWTVAPKYADEYMPVELYLNDTSDYGLFANFHMRQVGDETGEATFIITATAGDEVLTEREITISLTAPGVVVEPLIPELTELDILIRGAAPSNEFGTKWFLEFCERELNVKFNVEYVDSYDINGRLNEVMSDGSMPDMVMSSATVWEGEIMNWGYGSGQLLAIDEYAEYCPNYFAEISRQPELIAATTAPDGHTYGFSNIRQPHEGQSMGIPTIINRQWLENLGLEMPNTLDEFYNVLCAFRDQDANGNGDPTDEIPWAGVNSGGYPEFMVIKWAFGINGYRTDAVDSTTLEGYWAPYHPRYKEALAFMKKLYDEGLLYDGYFSATHDQLRSEMQASTEYAVVGFSIDDNRSSVTGSRSLWSQYDACNPFVADDTIVRNTWKGAPIDLFTWTISSKTEYPELCVRFCDLWYDPYMAICYSYGPEYGSQYDYWGTGWVYDSEGQSFSYPNGSNHLEYNSIMDGAGFGLEVSTAMSRYFEDWTYGKDWDEEEARYQATIAANNYPYEMPQYIGGYWMPEQQEIYDTYASACSTYTRAQEAMFISGERSWDEYDDYIAELTAMGGQQMNQLYKDYMEMVVRNLGGN